MAKVTPAMPTVPLSGLFVSSFRTPLKRTSGGTTEVGACADEVWDTACCWACKHKPQNSDTTPTKRDTRIAFMDVSFSPAYLIIETGISVLAPNILPLAIGQFAVLRSPSRFVFRLTLLRIETGKLCARSRWPRPTPQRENRH